MYGVKEFVCLSVTNFDTNFRGTGQTEWTEIYLGHLWQKLMSQKFIKLRSVIAICCEAN